MAADPNDVKQIIEIVQAIMSKQMRIKDVPKELIAKVLAKLAAETIKHVASTVLSACSEYTSIAAIILAVVSLVISGVFAIMSGALSGTSAARNWNFLFTGRSSRVNEEMIANARAELKNMNVDFKEKGYIGEDFVESSDYSDITYTTTFQGTQLTMDADQSTIISSSPTETKDKVKKLLTYIEVLDNELLSNGIEEEKRLTKKEDGKTEYYVDDGVEDSRLDEICSAYMKIKDKASNFYIKEYLIAQEYTTTNENEWTIDQRR